MTHFNNFQLKQAIYTSLGEAQIKKFDDIPGPTKDKYSDFTEAWTNIANLTIKFLDDAIPKHCFGAEIHETQTGVILRMAKAKAKTSPKEYRSYTDPRMIKRLADKATELDACYENSRNGNDVKDTVIYFCG